MSREETPQTFIKPRRKTAKICHFFFFIAAASIVSVTYFIFKKPFNCLENSSDQYVIKNIPKVYTNLDGVDPDEREVFEGFRTSFLPAEEIVFSKREVLDIDKENVNFLWGTSVLESDSFPRYKRKSSGDTYYETDTNYREPGTEEMRDYEQEDYEKQDHSEDIEGENYDDYNEDPKVKFENKKVYKLEKEQDYFEDPRNKYFFGQENYKSKQEHFEKNAKDEQYFHRNEKVGTKKENLEKIVAAEQLFKQGNLENQPGSRRPLSERKHIARPHEKHHRLHQPNEKHHRLHNHKDKAKNRFRGPHHKKARIQDSHHTKARIQGSNHSKGKHHGSRHRLINDNLRVVVHPATRADSGPLDDVVDQVRGQPELEEGEMGSAAHLYKPTRSFIGIHSFWKGQGDKETIKLTQAKIMRQHMDMDADPCHDFYQYACGNWAALNPIPADKAGYDTFEMLRENLDTVLKDLLEFKHSEKVVTKYPGPHLDPNDNFLYAKPVLEKETFKDMLDKLEDSLHHVNDTAEVVMKKKLNDTSKEIPSEFVNRLKRNIIKTPDKIEPKITENKFNNLSGVAMYNHRTKRSTKDLKENKTPLRKKYQPRRRSFLRKKIQSKVRRKLHKFDRKRSKRLKRNFIFNENEDEKDAAEVITREDPANGDAALKARFLFQSCMNYDFLDRRGHQPLLDLLNLLGGWPILDSSWTGDNFDWLELMATLRQYNNDILISEWVGPDIKNSDEFVIQFDQTSLGLPTRDYFLQHSNKDYLEAYKEYLIKIVLLLGGEPRHVKASADQLIDFEIKLAKITSGPEDRRNVSDLYKRMPLKKLQELVPQINWKRYLCVVMNRTVGPDETVVMFALTYVRHLVQLIKETEPRMLSNYLLWRFVRHRVNNLDDRFQSAKQQFYFVLFGREQSPPRWKNCISQVNSNMGMALGSMFVKKYFDETSKNDTLTMTREIQQSFREILHRIDWIDDETKGLAAHKVDAMMLRIGYPDFILNKKDLDDRYKEVRIHPNKYFENILNILQHLTLMEQSRIGQPVNKTLWNTAPAVVNAYYSRNKNQIMFPAGILQPPFYHRHFPRSLNYGGIGVVIGHEITHGFDDKGRLFDCNGNLHRWWSDSAIEAFHRRAQCLIDQYGQYVVPEVNMKLDGVNTQGENIADNGGVKQAFRAYLHWLQNHDAVDETLPGLNHTHKQLFFLNFAQVWCGAMRPEAMRNKLKTAVHSPGRFRVIGTLSNSDDFAREFQCPPGSPMNPVNKCNVW